MYTYIIRERIEAIYTALSFYREIFELIGFEMYTPSFLCDEEGNRVYGEDGRVLRIERKPLFTHTNVVDITDPKSVINYWAANVDLVSETLVNLHDYEEAHCVMAYCDRERHDVPCYEWTAPEHLRVIMDKLTEAETLLSHSRAIREMVQIE